MKNLVSLEKSGKYMFSTLTSTINTVDILEIKEYLGYETKHIQVVIDVVLHDFNDPSIQINKDELLKYIDSSDIIKELLSENILYGEDVSVLKAKSSKDSINFLTIDINNIELLISSLYIKDNKLHGIIACMLGRTHLILDAIKNGYFISFFCRSICHKPNLDKESSEYIIDRLIAYDVATFQSLAKNEQPIPEPTYVHFEHCEDKYIFLDTYKNFDIIPTLTTLSLSYSNIVGYCKEHDGATFLVLKNNNLYIRIRMR